MSEKPTSYDQEIIFSPFEICAYLQFQLQRLKKDENSRPAIIDYVIGHKQNHREKRKAQIKIGLKNGFGVILDDSDPNRPRRPIVLSVSSENLQDQLEMQHILAAQALIDALYAMAFCTHSYPVYIREDGSTCASHYELSTGEVGCPTRDRSYRTQLKRALHKPQSNE